MEEKGGGGDLYGWKRIESATDTDGWSQSNLGGDCRDQGNGYCRSETGEGLSTEKQNITFAVLVWVCVHRHQGKVVHSAVIVYTLAKIVCSVIEVKNLKSSSLCAPALCYISPWQFIMLCLLVYTVWLCERL